MLNQEINLSSNSTYLSTINSSGSISKSSDSALPATSVAATIPDSTQTSESSIFDGADTYVSSETTNVSETPVNTIDKTDIASLKAEADKQFEHFKDLVDSFISKQVRSFQFSGSFEYSASYSASSSSQESYQSNQVNSGFYNSSAMFNNISGDTSSQPMSFMDSQGLLSINQQEFYQVKESLKIDFNIEAEFDLSIDPATQQEALDLISEDGEWGAQKTSERLLEFAEALIGDDSSKIDLMKQAFIDGFNEVKELFGAELPEISENTYDLVMQGFDELEGVSS